MVLQRVVQIFGRAFGPISTDHRGEDPLEEGLGATHGGLALSEGSGFAGDVWPNHQEFREFGGRE